MNNNQLFERILSANGLFNEVLRENKKPQSFETSLKTSIFKKVLREAGKSKDDQTANCDDIMSVLASMRINDLVERLRDRLSDRVLPPELGQIVEKYGDRLAYVNIDTELDSIVAVTFGFIA